MRRASQRARRQRGAAYVQALVAMLMMIGVFAGAISFGHAYDAKVVTGQQARSEAWRAGGQGCGNSQGKLQADSQSVAKNVDDAGAGNVVDKLAKLFFSVSPRTAQANRRDARTPSWLGGRPVPFQTTTQFACNETPDMGSGLVSVAKWGLDLLRKAFQ